MLELFSCRYNLIKQIYSNTKIIAFELMLADIFAEANVFYNFPATISAPEKYVELTDNVLYDIEISTESVRAPTHCRT